MKFDSNVVVYFIKHKGEITGEVIENRHQSSLYRGGLDIAEFIMQMEKHLLQQNNQLPESFLCCNVDFVSTLPKFKGDDTRILHTPLS